MTTSIYQSSTLKNREQNFFSKSEKVHKGRWNLSKVVYVNNKKNII